MRFLSKTGDRNGKYRNPEDSGRNWQPRVRRLICVEFVKVIFTIVLSRYIFRMRVNSPV